MEPTKPLMTSVVRTVPAVTLPDEWLFAKAADADLYVSDPTNDYRVTMPPHLNKEEAEVVVEGVDYEPEEGDGTRQMRYNPAQLINVYLVWE